MNAYAMPLSSNILNCTLNSFLTEWKAIQIVLSKYSFHPELNYFYFFFLPEREKFMNGHFQLCLFKMQIKKTKHTRVMNSSWLFWEKSHPIIFLQCIGHLKGRETHHCDILINDKFLSGLDLKDMHGLPASLE